MSTIHDSVLWKHKMGILMVDIINKENLFVEIITKKILAAQTMKRAPGGYYFRGRHEARAPEATSAVDRERRDARTCNRPRKRR